MEEATSVETDSQHNPTVESPMPSSTDVSFSNQGVKSLLELLVKRGYFHEGIEPPQANCRRGIPVPNEDEAEEEEVLPTPYTMDDNACQVVFLEEDSDDSLTYCCTYPALLSNLRIQLKDGGRVSTNQLVTALRLRDEAPILRLLQEENFDNTTDDNMFQIGSDIVSSEFLDRVSQRVLDSLQGSTKGKKEDEQTVSDDNIGLAMVSDLSNREFHLPMEITLQALKTRLPSGFQLLELGSGIALAEDGFMERYKQKVLDYFGTLQEPVVISDVCHQRSWDVDLVATWVQEACHGTLAGDFHGGSNATSLSIGSMYTPHAHVQALREAIDELFGAQGYMTASRGAALGLSKAKMGDYIKESFPSAVLVSDNLVVSSDAILAPLEAVFQEAIAVLGFVDLQSHLPVDILDQEEDTRKIAEELVISSISKQDETKKNSKTKKKKASASVGVVVLSSSGGLFVSTGMIQHIQKNIVPDLIGKHAKSRAEEIDASGEASTATTDSSKSSSKKKGGRKGKKGSKASQDETNNNSNAETSKDVVPLAEIVKSVGLNQPELLDVDPLMKEAMESNGQLPQLSWEKTDESAEMSGDTAIDRSLNESILCELCRSCLYTDDLISSCQRAIQVELKRLESARMSKASVSRKDAAAKVRNVESAFEEWFVNGCYMLQEQAKFLEYVESWECPNEDDATTRKKLLLDKLRDEHLDGCCADFTSRLTQYCLFKNEIDPSMFQFHSTNITTNTDKDDNKEDGGLPLYCTPVDLANRQYPSTFLQLADSGNKGKVKEPLPKLREELPGSMGVSLARQWVACGGSCYQGGSKVDDAGSEFTRPGDLEKFTEYVQENCLSLCGFPFKKLDKKSEKQLLFARRQHLMRLLEETDDASGVLDLTMMLLFQQVKSVVSLGVSRHRSDLLALLISERKINDQVAELLQKLLTALDGSTTADSALIGAVKGCGLCRDISKHEIEICLG
ncbi:expressed unknown protein [Seminavis robusta]|uniref:Uncharacterized protein n=1 Tax=Seminavis robusta TaxID=568900 RepID=A0A9N8E973_9STRA|nr:expressed unknown protein [Seminavis robusta]|eukprot:Sro688_g187410.1 n/a (965) ;mRNA; r:33939-37039